MKKQSRLLISKIIDLTKGKIFNGSLLKKYVDSGKPITFFNWEFYKQIVRQGQGVNYFDFDFSIRKTKTYRLWARENRFFQCLQKYNVQYAFYKFIPDELVPLICPEWIIRTGNDAFVQKNKRFCESIRNILKRKYRGDNRVLTISTILNSNQTLAQIYWQSYVRVLSSFNSSYNSSYVTRKNFKEDVRFRLKHYSEASTINLRQAKEYSIQMFSLFAAETSLLLAMQKIDQLPQLVLLNSETNLSIKKYETLQKFEQRQELPKICL